MLQLCVCRDVEHLGSLGSTREVRVALNSFAFFVYSRLPACAISRYTHNDAWTNCQIAVLIKIRLSFTGFFKWSVIINRIHFNTFGTENSQNEQNWNITNLKFRLHHKKWQIRTVHKQSLSLSLLTQYCTATAKHFKLTEILKSAC